MPVYDEIYDENGTMRGPYAAIQRRTGIDVTKPSGHAVATLRSGAPGSDRPIHPIPLVLDEDEYQSTIVPGLLQRAFVLQALFEDIAIGPGKVLDTGILRPEELGWIVLSEGIEAEALRRMWRGQSREQIRFVYGPDLVRNPAGEWVSLEDNIGCVGGVARGTATRDAYLKATGLAADLARTSPGDLARAVEAFLDQAGMKSNSKGIYGIAGWTSANGKDPNDFETAWKADRLRSLGICVTQPEDLLDLIRRGAAHVSAIVNLSATMAFAYRQLAEATFVTAKTPVMGAPCVGLTASKSFLAFDQALATVYLGEQLMIRSASSCLVHEPQVRLPGKGVLKRSNGCGGTEVFFLDEIRGEVTREDLLTKLRAWGPCAAILQETIERSVLIGASDPAALEIRPIVYVYGWRKAIVGEVVTARANPARGERRGNLSRGAFLVPVLREASVRA